MPITPINAAGPSEWPKRLGKKPARPGAVRFSLANYVNLELPTPPAFFRHPDPPTFHSYDNEKYGNCVWVGAANETALWEHEGGLPIPKFTVKEVNACYSEVTGFDPKNPKKTDQGTDMAEAARYRRSVGILDVDGKRHKIDAYAAVRLESMKHLRAAMWVLGGVGLGFRFPVYAMDQFDNGQPWSVNWSWRHVFGLPDKIKGGHYVPAIGIARNGNIICVSWGTEQEMTPGFYLRYADEVYGFMDACRLRDKLSPEGFDERRLEADLAAVAQGRVYALGQWPTEFV